MLNRSQETNQVLLEGELSRVGPYVFPSLLPAPSSNSSCNKSQLGFVSGFTTVNPSAIANTVNTHSPQPYSL